MSQKLPLVNSQFQQSRNLNVAVKVGMFALDKIENVLKINWSRPDMEKVIYLIPILNSVLSLRQTV